MSLGRWSIRRDSDPPFHVGRVMCYPLTLQMHGQGKRIRTSDLLGPDQALYQTELYLDGSTGADLDSEPTLQGVCPGFDCRTIYSVVKVPK